MALTGRAKSGGAGIALRQPTLLDVAREAGVSTATVSRVLNAPSRVQQDTRDRVEAAVASLGYRPNVSARALAAGRTGTIGAVIPTMENAIFARGLQAFQESLGAAGFTLLVASSSYSEALEEEQIRTLAARGADGLLLIGHHRQARILDFLAARRIPALAAWAWRDDSAMPGIGFSNHDAMRDLARAVIAAGHRRIGMITAETAANDRARDRVEGVRSAMAEAGLDPAALRVAETAYGFAEGADAFDRLIAAAAPPTAVICANDVLAVGAIGAARAAGLTVPDDVSITGFDDIEIATIVAPPLTTVHVPHREMGLHAADMLVAMVEEGRLTAPGARLGTGLRLRGTLAPPPTRDRRPV
jgi:LacI family transcriptional regulator